MASIGTAKIAPGTPHIQNQNTSDRITGAPGGGAIAMAASGRADEVME
jgi:hypothetical protein